MLNDNLAGQSVLGGRFPVLSPLQTPRHSLRAWEVAAEEPADGLGRFPRYLTCCSLPAFRVLSVSHLPLERQYRMSWCGSPWVCLIGDSLPCRGPGVCSLSQVRTVFSPCFLKYRFFAFFSLSLPFGIPIIWTFVCLMWPQSSLQVILFLYSPLPPLLWLVGFYSSVFQAPDPFFRGSESTVDSS